MGLTKSTPHGTYCGSGPARGCGWGTPSIRAGKRHAYPARTPLRSTVYPTPVLGTAGVPGYGAGPFVPSGYKWRARTTELHPDGESKHRTPHGETPGEGTRADDKDPPPPTTTGKARAGHQGNTAPSDTEKRQKEDGTQRGRQGDTPPTDPSQGGRGTTQPRRERGYDRQPPHQTEPPNHTQKGEDRHPNAPQTHRTLARACTQHTPPQPPPTRAPQTHTTLQSASAARTTNATHTNPKNKNPATPPARGAAEPPETPLGHKGGPTKPSARSGERPHPATPKQPRTTPGPGATTPTPAPPPTPKPDATTPSPADTPGTNGDTVGNTSDPSTQYNTRTPSPTTNQHKKPPNTDQRPHPAGPVPHRPAPRTTATIIHAIENTNTTKNQASTTPSPTPSPPAPSPTKPTHTTTGWSTYITQANGIKHTIAGITPPSASPPATSATGGHQSHYSR